MVLLNGTSNSWPCEERVKDLEDTEHLIGILSLRQLCLEDGSNLGLYFVNFEIVSTFSLIPQIKSFFADVEHIDTVEELVGLIDLAECHILQVFFVSRDLV